jgi:selenocysteine lyase/cysteine desulfurase
MIYLDSAATSLIKPKSVGYSMLEAMRTMASPAEAAFRRHVCADTVWTAAWQLVSYSILMIPKR